MSVRKYFWDAPPSVISTYKYRISSPESKILKRVRYFDCACSFLIVMRTWTNSLPTGIHSIERLSFDEYATGLTQLQRQAAYVSRYSLANIHIFQENCISWVQHWLCDTWHVFNAFATLKRTFWLIKSINDFLSAYNVCRIRGIIFLLQILRTIQYNENKGITYGVL